jgi:hypothetical protein
MPAAVVHEAMLIDSCAWCCETEAILLQLRVSWADASVVPVSQVKSDCESLLSPRADLSNTGMRPDPTFSQLTRNWRAPRSEPDAKAADVDEIVSDDPKAVQRFIPSSPR